MYSTTVLSSAFVLLIPRLIISDIYCTKQVMAAITCYMYIYSIHLAVHGLQVII